MAQTFPCPHCGEDVPVRSKFCKECGSDAGTGWSDEAEVGGLDLPESMSDDEYEKFLAKEFGDSAGGRPAFKMNLWQIAAVILILAFLAFVLT